MKLYNILSTIDSCKKCDGLNPWNKLPACSHGKHQANTIIVGRNPGCDSFSQQQYWSGPSGCILRKPLREINAEIKLEDIFYLTDVVKCTNINNGSCSNAKPSSQVFDNCRNFLDDELNAIKPKYIIALGKEACEYFNLSLPCNISDIIHCSSVYIFYTTSYQILPLPHPSYTLHNPTIQQDYQDYLKKVYLKVLNGSDV